MSKYEFTLIVDGPDLQDESLIESMLEAGFDDATIGRVGSIQYLDFDRGAESFADAVFSAAKSLESAVPGARVVQLEPDDLVTMSEIAERVGRTRESVRLLIYGDRGPGGFRHALSASSTYVAMARSGCLAHQPTRRDSAY
jgi:hypothetical protein